MMNVFKKIHPTSLFIYLLLALFFVFSPFYQGIPNAHELFLEPYLHGTFIYASFLIIALVAWLFYSRTNPLTRFDVLPILIWLLPVCFIISLTSAVATQDAINSIQIHVFNVSLFLAGFFLATSREGLKPFVYILYLSGYILILVTMSDWLGSNLVQDSVVYSIGDYRIFSPILYPNSYAALMIAFFFVSSYMAVTSKDRRAMIMSAVLTIPALLSLILTYSRGGYVIFVVLYIIFLFMMPIVRQILFLSFTIVAVGLTGILYPFISRIGIQQQTNFSFGSYLSGWLLILAGCTLLVIFTIYVIPRLQTRLSNKTNRPLVQKSLQFVIPLISIIMIGMALFALSSDSVLKLLPEQLQTRLSNLNFRQHSVLERITFYKDAVKIVEDYPLTGAGGGAWNALYPQYQNNPYITKEPHNFMLTHMVETGLLGMGILLAFLIIVYYRFVRQRRSDEDFSLKFVFFMFATSILIHSLIDFNLAFLYISGLVYLSLGIISSSKTDNISTKDRKSTSARRSPSFLRFAYIGTLTVVAIIMVFVSSRSIYAYRLYTKTFEESGGVVSAEQSWKDMNTVLDLKPNHPHYLTGMVALMHAFYEADPDPVYLQYAKTYIDRLKKVDTNFKIGPDVEFEHYQILNDTDQLADAAIYWARKFPYKVSLYETAIPLLYNLGTQQKNSGGTSHRWDQAIELYEMMREGMARIEALPEEQLPGEDFYISEPILFTILNIVYAQGQDEQVLTIIQDHYGVVNIDSPRVIIRMYLLAQIRLDQVDEELYDQFIERYPDEINIFNSLN